MMTGFRCIHDIVCIFILCIALLACDSGGEQATTSTDDADRVAEQAALLIGSVPQVGKDYSLQSVHSGLFLDLEGNATGHGAGVVQASKSTNATQVWTLQTQNSAFYLVNKATSMCLNIVDQSKSKGALLEQWECNGGGSELWQYKAAENASYSLASDWSDMVVDVADLSTASGHQVQQWPWADGTNQRWLFVSPNNAAAENVSSGTKYLASTTADEMIYNIYTPVYSAAGNLESVTQDLPRIAGMGFSTVLLMPINPIGKATGGHPTFQSPYAVADYYAVSPDLGSLNDLTTLVSRAHALGIKVILDVVLNHTAWTNPLIMQHPEFYVHTDGNKKNIDSIAQAFTYADVAQLDYKSDTALQQYMGTMLSWWVKNYHLDGFRFDGPDNPYGDGRMIPASTWTYIGDILNDINPGLMLLGEESDPALSLQPFNVDYDSWSVQPVIAAAATSQDATKIASTIVNLKARHPAGMLHLCIMQDWDMDMDLNMYGGADSTLAAAVMNFTIEGVPLLFAGEEVGNNVSSVNSRTAINWNAPLENRFTPFYQRIGMLRRTYGALRTGGTTWLSANGNKGLVVFTRTGQVHQFLIAVNFSSSAVTTTIQNLASGTWIEMTPPGAGQAVKHPAPPSLKLGPKDFAIFRRNL